MWLGDYSLVNLLGIFLQAAFIQNILLSTFLGMCSYLACSSRLSTANGLGMSVALVLTITGSINWLVHHFITGPHALAWLSPALADIDLSFFRINYIHCGYCSIHTNFRTSFGAIFKKPVFSLRDLSSPYCSKLCYFRRSIIWYYPKLSFFSYGCIFFRIRMWMVVSYRSFCNNSRKTSVF